MTFSIHHSRLKLIFCHLTNNYIFVTPNWIIHDLNRESSNKGRIENFQNDEYEENARYGDTSAGYTAEFCAIF